MQRTTTALLKLIVVLFVAIEIVSGAFAASQPGMSPEQDGRLSPWRKKWAEKSTGWHQEDVNEALVKHLHLLVPAGNGTCKDLRIFVPLCGKTVDMAYLASQPNVHQVVGVDGVRQALEEFVEEHSSLSIQPAVSPQDTYELFTGNKIILLKGDYFELDESLTEGRFDAVWDRASIIAIQPNLRQDYVKTMSKLVKQGGTLLLSTLERRTGTPEALAMGPPFSMPEAEIRRLYEGQSWVESVTLLEETDQFEQNPKDRERFGSSGVTSLFNLVFLIRAKS